MVRQKKRVPLKEELLQAMKVAQASAEAADYLVMRFKAILSEAKLLDKSKDIIAKVEDFAKYVHFKLLSSAQPWSGEIPQTSDFQNMQQHLAQEATKQIEETMQGELTLDLAIKDTGELLRGYTSEGKPLDPELVEPMDKLFNAWLAKQEVLIKSSKLQACDAKGEISQEEQTKTTEKIRQLIDDKKQGFPQYMKERGMSVSINTRDYPETQLDVEKKQALEQAIESKSAQL